MNIYIYIYIYICITESFCCTPETNATSKKYLKMNWKCKTCTFKSKKTLLNLTKEELNK